VVLEACRECGREISTDANLCPHCGVRLAPTTADHFRQSCQFGCYTGVALTAIIMFVLMWLLG
jgi:predicted amidophosphoribosyltransferase